MRGTEEEPPDRSGGFPRRSKVGAGRRQVRRRPLIPPCQLRRLPSPPWQISPTSRTSPPSQIWPPSQVSPHSQNLGRLLRFRRLLGLRNPLRFQPCPLSRRQPRPPRHCPNHDLKVLCFSLSLKSQRPGRLGSLSVEQVMDLPLATPFEMVPLVSSSRHPVQRQSSSSLQLSSSFSTIAQQFAT